MAHGARRVDAGTLQRFDAVLEHTLALAQHERQRQAALKVLARDDLVKALVGEELWPMRQVAVVETFDVLGVELVDFEAQIHVVSGSSSLISGSCSYN